MQILLCLVLLVSVNCYHTWDHPGTHNFAVSNKNYGHVNSLWPRHNIRQDHLSHHQNDQDPDSHIIRPCSIHDLNCIRSFLNHHFGCTPIRGHSSEPYVIDFTIAVPIANSTFTLYDTELSAIRNGRIAEFHIDKNTDTLVLQVTFDKFIIDSPRVTHTYYRNGKAPLEATDYGFVACRKLSLTWTVKKMHDHKGAVSHVYAYLGDRTVIINEGPKLREGEFESINNVWRNAMITTVLEAMVNQAPIFFQGYMETTVCKLPKIF